MHLGDAQCLGDLGLTHVAVEPHHEQALLAGRQLGQVPPHGLDVDGVPDLRILGAHQVTGGDVVFPGQRRVQGGQLKDLAGQLGCLELGRADAEPSGQLGVGGPPGQLLGQLLGAGADPSRSSWARRCTRICQRLSRKYRLISPLTHGWA